MNTEQLIAKAVKASQGKKFEIGTAVAHPDDPITRELVAYEDDGNTAVLSWGGITARWPSSEIFSPNEARDYAVMSKCLMWHDNRRR